MNFCSKCDVNKSVIILIEISISSSSSFLPYSWCWHLAAELGGWNWDYSRFCKYHKISKLSTAAFLTDFPDSHFFWIDQSLCRIIEKSTRHFNQKGILFKPSEFTIYTNLQCQYQLVCLQQQPDDSSFTAVASCGNFGLIK